VSALVALLALVAAQATPLALAALGGVVSERAGVAALGLEGMMRVGAFAATWATAATGSPALGLLAGVAAGAALALLLAVLAVALRADQVVSGIALNLVALGLVTFMLEAVFGSASIAPAAPLPPLPAILGPAPLAVLAGALPLAVAWALDRTPFGLALRAAGERPRALAAAGGRPGRVRAVAVVASGALAGLGGAVLPLALLHRFDDRMPAGLGFMALAAVVFGRWRPVAALGASVFFAAGNAAADLLRGVLPPAGRALHLDGLLLALPYLVTLAALAVARRDSAAPAALGRAHDAAEPG
jgi:simple sugar transport system permease protein